MRAVFVLALPLLMLAACASPEQASGPDQQQVAQARQCDRGESQTGSMLAKRVCGPPLSEEERRRVAEEASRTFQKSHTSAPGSGK